MRDRYVARAVTLFRQGDSADCILVLHRGMVRLSRLMESGDEFTFALRGSGSLLGAAPAIAEMYHDVEAVTLTKAHVSVIAAGEFRTAVKNDVSLGWQLQRLQACELIEQAREISVRHCGRARTRILDVLQQIMCEQAASGSVMKIQLPFSHRELARLVGISPEHLSRVLSELERDCVIMRSGHEFAIRSPNSHPDSAFHEL